MGVCFYEYGGMEKTLFMIIATNKKVKYISLQGISSQATLADAFEILFIAIWTLALGLIAMS